MKKVIFLSAILFISFLVYAADYDLGNSTGGLLAEGTYQGSHSFVTVSVTVKNSRIDDIKMLKHGGGGKKYADMIEGLLDKIIQEESTAVDDVTGATVSSQNLKMAVDDALQKAYQK